MSDALVWLQAWYLSQCDGDWEHESGIAIDTLDNPGWAVRIDLRSTALEDAVLHWEKVERSEHDWVFWEAKDGEFRAACGPGNLLEVLSKFRQWVSSAPNAIDALQLDIGQFEARKRARLGA